ncbi:MAG: winged helix-turn-helix domain-containing protein [Nanoarchaeota archaeon]|nr:winged helix-turn-helix domain-containing protein [Nanoarchaeota archaeon]
MKVLDIKPIIFEKKFKVEKDVKVRERLQLLWYLCQGYNQREVANMLSISNGIVSFWKTRFEQEEFTGLQDKKGRGRKAALSEDQLSMLGSALNEGILLDDDYHKGFNTKDVRGFIYEEFEHQYTPRHCRGLLKKIGCSMQVPRPRNKSRNQAAVDEFKRKLKKNVPVWILT